MPADTYGSILGLIQQGTGNNNNSWGVTFNNSFATPSERADAGVDTITATRGTVDLSTTFPPAGLRLDIDHIQLLTGALTADLTVKVPNVSKTWQWLNKSTPLRRVSHCLTTCSPVPIKSRDAMATARHPLRSYSGRSFCAELVFSLASFSAKSSPPPPPPVGSPGWNGGCLVSGLGWRSSGDP